MREVAIDEKSMGETNMSGSTDVGGRMWEVKKEKEKEKDATTNWVKAGRSSADMRAT